MKAERCAGLTTAWQEEIIHHVSVRIQLLYSTTRRTHPHPHLDDDRRELKLVDTDAACALPPLKLCPLCIIVVQSANQFSAFPWRCDFAPNVACLLHGKTKNKVSRATDYRWMDYYILP